MTAPTIDRTDWIMLLPASLPLPVDVVVVAGGTDAQAQALVDGGVALRWTRGHALGTPTAARLVVCWPDADITMEAAAGHVAPGGVMVIQLHRRGIAPRSAAGLRRRVHGLGCTVEGMYVVSPDLAAPRRFLPLDSAAALRWHLRTLFVSGSWVSWIARTATAALTRTGPVRVALAAASRSLLVVASRAPNPTSTTVIGSPDGSAGEHVIVLTSGYDLGSRTVVLPFVDAELAPRRVIKVATTADFAGATQREHERLVELHTVLPPPLRRGLPLPLGLTSILGRVACIQSCAPGRSLQALTGDVARSRRRKHRDLQLAAGWLDGLATATRAPTSSASAAWSAVFHDVVARTELDASARALVSIAASRAESTGMAKMSVYQHFDAGPWNVHLDRRLLCFVDWESDARRPHDSLGPPLADVLYLATYWYFVLTGASANDTEERALVDLFVTRMPANASVVAARRVVDVSLGVLDLDRSCVPAALVALWAERALYTAARHAEGSPVRVKKSGLSRPSRYLQVLAEHSPVLFGNDGWWALPVGTEVSNDHPSRRIPDTQIDH